MVSPEGARTFSEKPLNMRDQQSGRKDGSDRKPGHRVERGVAGGVQRCTSPTVAPPLVPQNTRRPYAQGPDPRAGSPFLQ
ncbi:hypothetical protein GCM10010331_69430 [Streptomyces xanthochromogenes]|nr:hypothetical protein GCM10010331_69430 [Streptomyces xanthochromogenes]